MIRVFILSAMLISLGLACRDQPAREIAMLGMSRDSLILINIHTFIDSLWNQKDTTFLRKISSPQFERNLNGIQVADSRREMQSHLTVFFTAFPDLKCTLNQVFLENGMAFILWTTEGTNTGIFGEISATGKKVKINGMEQMYFNEEGKLYQEYVYYNELDLLQQLGYTLSPPVLE